ncbi:MAG: hypothetical protein JWP89_5400 [Schlesneria sp.]|nr:hypothetical protein [Schlesneria sp.]
MESDNSKPPQRRSVILGGGRQTLAVVLVLLLVIAFAKRGDPSLGILSPLVVIGVGLYLYFRVAKYLLGRAGLWIVVLTVVLGVVSFGFVQYQAFLRYEELVERLAQYDEITIMQHNGLPTSPVDQISFKNDVDDEAVEKVIAMPEFANVSHIYFDASKITDRGLRAVSHLKLEYIYIGVPEISEEAIAEFEEEHPKCSVIVSSHR